jgi:hypothetical protein
MLYTFIRLRKKQKIFPLYDWHRKWGLVKSSPFIFKMSVAQNFYIILDNEHYH